MEGPQEGKKAGTYRQGRRLQSFSDISAVRCLMCKVRPSRACMKAGCGPHPGPASGTGGGSGRAGRWSPHAFLASLSTFFLISGAWKTGPVSDTSSMQALWTQIFFQKDIDLFFYFEHFVRVTLQVSFCHA